MCVGGAERCTYAASEPIVADFAISTPMPLIDSAFAAAISGLENTYEPGKAWFEGLQGWKSYWCNNYQVDAAVHLGGKWLQRARNAIMFFAQRPGGLGSIYTASGSKADARAALQIADLKKELKKEITDATDRADANMDTIRALLDEMRAGGRRSDGVGGDAAVEEKAG